MTYLCYFRGKLNELSALSNKAELISKTGMIPVIEPVVLDYKRLAKTCNKLNKENSHFVLIANSTTGKCLIESQQHVNHIKELASKSHNNKIGIIIDPHIFDIKKLLDFIAVYNEFNLVAIHPKSKNKTKFFEPIRDYIYISKNFTHDICLHNEDNFTSSVSNPKSILLDGFHPRNNSDYPEEEFFSDTHLKHKTDGFENFGDFNIVGDKYSEGGGPAYAVAIHLTYVDEGDKNIRIIHPKSISNHDAKNPANKYSEARDELIRIINSKKYNVRITDGINKIIKNNKYQGLGMLKRHCMEHHLEVIGEDIISRSI